MVIKILVRLTQTGASEGVHDDSSPVETRRDAVHGSHNNLLSWLDQGNDRIKPDGTLERAERQLVNDNIWLSWIAEHASPPQLAIRPTPPAEQRPVEQQRGRNRRRRQLFDESRTLLTNKIMKAKLKDCDDLLCKRKHCPSALDVWKLNNRAQIWKLNLRHNEGQVDNDVQPAFMHTPASAGNLSPESEPQPGTTMGTGVQPTPDPAALWSEIDTPTTFFEERDGVDNSGLSDIPEVVNSAKADARLV
ncbi:hypothetical protein RHMOL_Rhmol07G0065100 [Rhododendron molle]|uniref:Uncharacterized protein n=1 Tax=Rhododendron molle TaxID=49168 RepID=A0ACC0MZS4_RHOML|nr:hypothetical protein RHMOL_Rhmol07G0065100 [Rhododendron molle]